MKEVEGKWKQCCGTCSLGLDVLVLLTDDLMINLRNIRVRLATNMHDATLSIALSLESRLVSCEMPLRCTGIRVQIELIYPCS